MESRRRRRMSRRRLAAAVAATRRGAPKGAQARSATSQALATACEAARGRPNPQAAAPQHCQACLAALTPCLPSCSAHNWCRKLAAIRFPLLSLPCRRASRDAGPGGLGAIPGELHLVCIVRISPKARAARLSAPGPRKAMSPQGPGTLAAAVGAAQEATVHEEPSGAVQQPAGTPPARREAERREARRAPRSS